jgi:hypothetical protein
MQTGRRHGTRPALDPYWLNGESRPFGAVTITRIDVRPDSKGAGAWPASAADDRPSH